MASKIADAYVQLSAKGMEEVARAAGNTAKEIEKPAFSLEKFSSKLDLAMGGGALAIINAFGGAFAALGANVRTAVDAWDKGEGSLVGILDSAARGIPLVGGFYGGIVDLGAGLSTLTARALDSAQGIERINVEIEKLRSSEINQSIRNIGDLRRQMELLNSEGAEKELAALRHAFGARMDEIDAKRHSADITQEQLKYLEDEESQLRRVHAAQVEAIKTREREQRVQAEQTIELQKQRELAASADQAQRAREQRATEAARNLERMRGDAARLLETLKTPEQIVADRVGQLRDYLRAGVIDAQQFEALAAKAREDLAKGAEVMVSSFRSSFMGLDQFAAGIQTSIASQSSENQAAKDTATATQKLAKSVEGNSVRVVVKSGMLRIT
jgi:hypothetical protein